MPQDDEFVPLGRIIYYTAQELFNAGEKALKPYDVTLEQLYLMKCLTETDGIMQKDLGDMISKTPANTTRILDRLELKGFVQRQRCPDDRRAIRIYMTATGNDVYGQGKEFIESLTLTTYQGTTKDELAATRRFCNKVRANIEDLNRKLEEK